MRQIIEGEYFASCVAQLGGYRAIDLAIESIIEALANDPYAFPLVENDWCSVRYAQTKAIEGYIPPLIVAFVIDDQKNVILQWAEMVDEAEI